MTDFMNLNIKQTQSFRDTHRDRIYVHIFLEVSAHTYMSICVYTVFLKKSQLICTPENPGVVTYVAAIIICRCHFIFISVI
jgi:hypothetical protein